MARPVCFTHFHILMFLFVVSSECLRQRRWKEELHYCQFYKQNGIGRKQDVLKLRTNFKDFTLWVQNQLGFWFFNNCFGKFLLVCNEQTV